MKASHIIAKLMDRMADIGDFDVEPGYLQIPEAVAEKTVEVTVDQVAQAYEQGKKAATYSEVLPEHNPFSPDSAEAAAWSDGFALTRGDDE